MQAAYFATSAAASAFTLASQVPNLFSNLFSQAALSAAFVPVFTELLSKGRKREAFRVASTLFWVILIALGALTVLWTLVAGLVVPAFTGSHIPNGLTAGLSRVLFPVVLLLSLTGLLVGILQSYDEFTIPAIAPAVWNLVILLGLVTLYHRFNGNDRIYAYAIAWLVATVVQFLMVFAALRRIEFKVSFVCDWRDPRVKQVLILFIPVTISIGIVNLDIFLNAGFGSLVSSAAPAAINDAFRIYMLPAGDLQRRGRDRAVPDAQPDGGAPRRERDAKDDRERDAPDQPAADPVLGAAARAGDADHAPRLPARHVRTRRRPISSRRRCSGSRSASRSRASTCC